ncbi:MAG TPA: glycosyltransferase family 4 protein [Gaiellaceae bacterium]|nr:glycosyltransferase family 4 protein [Gaiellaceae bacterium]
MRVALVGPYPASADRPAGGVESSFVNLLSGLASLDGLELAVVTFAPGEADPPPSDAGIRVRRLPAPRRLNNVTLYRTARRLLRSTLAELRPDLVHAQDALGYGYVCLRAARVPVVVSVHGIVRETRKQLRRPRDRLQAALAGVAVERFCVRHARYLLQPTPYPQAYFGSEIRGRVVEVGNPVAERLFAVEPAPEPGRVLFAGAVVPGKRVLDLVEALARVPGASLRVAGGAPDPAYAAAVAARARALGVDDRLELLGRLDAGRMLEEYRRAAVLALPSAQETSPMVVAEAMAVGVPVVATRVGGLPHLVEEGRTGFLVEAGDVAALADRIGVLLADAGTRTELASAARARAERFRPAAVAARVHAVYEEALR